MAIDAFLARMRRRERDLAARAGSTCVVSRPAGPGTFNPATGGYDDPPAATVLYDGACLIRPGSDIASDLDAAGQEITQGRWTIKVFDLETSFSTGDEVFVTASRQRPQLVGITFTVETVPLDDWTVWPRLVCTTDDTAPEVTSS